MSIVSAAPAFAAGQPLRQALASLRARLAAQGASSAALDARCLVEKACGFDRASLVAHGDEPLGRSAERLAALAARRLSGEPLARILGAREFWGLSFSLSAATLVPRPETETLVEAVLRHCRDSRGASHPWRILDLGTGSGCIAIALLTELPRATALGIDRSAEALLTARRNARRHGVADRAHWIAADWASAVSSSFDIVASNPPYIASSDIAELATEVRDHDPLMALDGGADGLDSYRSIIGDLARLLTADGRVFLEIGAGQELATRTLLEGRGLATRSFPDLAGVARVVSAQMPASGQLRPVMPANDSRMPSM
ncbi:MAG: peptide chain release factor N(5)-glutamine methyltransferase [Hyphomicrobiales bacterium]